MKLYATLNRQGTLIRIQPKHKLLWNYLSQRIERNGRLPRMTDDNPTSVELVSKNDWDRISGELKMGFKESFIKVIDRKNSGGIIIGCESMKKEILNATKFIQKVNEAKQEEEE